MERDDLTDLDGAISALRDGTRRRILFDFYVHEPEWTADDVAKAVGVHRTVAHRHLERLVALGYLTTAPRRGRTGKPAKLYRLAGKQIDVSYPARRFARLSALLAESLLEQGRRGPEAARTTGTRYGATLVTRPANTPDEALRALVPLGAEYVRADPERVLAKNCIFRQACALAPEVVCELHAGLLEGALRQAGLRLRVDALRDFDRFGCAYRLVAV